MWLLRFLVCAVKIITFSVQWPVWYQVIFSPSAEAVTHPSFNFKRLSIMSSHLLLPVSIAYALDLADPPCALLLLLVLTSHVNICKFISVIWRRSYTTKRSWHEAKKSDALMLWRRKVWLKKKKNYHFGLSGTSILWVSQTNIRTNDTVGITQTWNIWFHNFLFFKIRSVNFKIVFQINSWSSHLLWENLTKVINYSSQSIFTAACHTDHMASQFFVLPIQVHQSIPCC